MKISSLLAFMVSIAVLIFSGTGVSAQDAPSFCGGLSEPDCSILTDSQETMGALESAAAKFKLDMTFSGIPDAPGTVTISLLGDGRYTITNADALQNFAANMSDDPAGAMEDLFKAFSLGGTFILQLPADLMGEDKPNRGAFSVRLVDGFVYANFDKLVELIGGSSRPSGWMGFDLAGFYGRLFDQMGGNLGRTQNPPDNIDVISDFVTIERIEDVEADDQNFATFRYTIDYGELLSNESFRNAIRNQLENTDTMGQIDVDAVMDLYAQAFDAMELEVTQMVGLEDHYVHHLALQLDWTLDMAALGAVIGRSTAGMSNITINMSMDADLSQFNEAAPIEAPENATIFPIDSMLPAMPQAFQLEATA